MTTTISAGASAVVSVPAGDIMTGTGAGLATFGVAGFQALTAGDSWQIGPFDKALSVSISAASAISYAVGDMLSNPSPADGLSADEVALFRASVSGARKLDSNAATLRRSRTVHPAPPTISYSLSAPTGKRWELPWPTVAAPVGCVLTYADGTGTLTATANNGFFGLEMLVSGTEVTMAWRTSLSAGERVMIFLDGQPCMSAPATPSVITTAGSYAYVTVTFGAAVTDARLEILITSGNSLVGLYTSADTSCAPAPTKLKVMVVGDSFMAGSAATTVSQVPPSLLALGYDLSVASNALGGTGYLTDNGSLKRWSDATRVADATAFQPNKLVFFGSTNDDDKTASLQAAVVATVQAYQAVVPSTTTITIYGPPPSDDVATLGANRTANNRAVRKAAAQLGLTFIDQIGTAGDADLTAFTAGMTCQPGVRYTYLGSVWEFIKTTSSVMPGGYAPGNNSAAPYWRLVTAAGYFGTGRVGATTSDGSRDTLLAADDLHPSPRGCANIAAMLAAGL